MELEDSNICKAQRVIFQRCALSSGLESGATKFLQWIFEM